MWTHLIAHPQRAGKDEENADILFIYPEVITVVYGE